MSGVMPSLVRMPSCHAQIQLYFARGQNKVTGTLRSGLEPGPFVTPPFSEFSEFHTGETACSSL